jgi:hypothetical protein
MRVGNHVITPAKGLCIAVLAVCCPLILRRIYRGALLIGALR